MDKDHAIYVSVVMTSYNRAHFIAQAIDSILEQECNFPFEIIIGDDCSTDNSRELLQSYKDKYSSIFVLNFHKANVGFGVNWASSVMFARGKYLTFLDDDDYYCDNHRLQEMVDYMEAHTDCGLLHTNYYRLYMENGKMVPNDARDATGEDAMMGLYRGTYPLCFGTCMIRKSLFDKHVNLHDYINLNFPIQDWPTCMQLAPYTEFHYLDRLSYVYRRHVGSMSSPTTYDALISKYASEKRMYKYICAKFPTKLHYDAYDWEQYVNNMLLSLAYQRGEYCKAKQYAKHAGKLTKRKFFANTWLSFHLFRLMKMIRIKSAIKLKHYD